jgi:hypothetical protein
MIETDKVRTLIRGRRLGRMCRRGVTELSLFSWTMRMPGKRKPCVVGAAGALLLSCAIDGRAGSA